MPAPWQGLLGSYLSSHTHPVRGQMGAGALWAADCLTDTPAWGDVASQALLYEASGVGALGLSHPGPAPRHPLQQHLCSLTHSASPMASAVPASPAGVL